LNEPKKDDPQNEIQKEILSTLKLLVNQTNSSIHSPPSTFTFPQIPFPQVPTLQPSFPIPVMLDNNSQITKTQLIQEINNLTLLVQQETNSQQKITLHNSLVELYKIYYQFYHNK